ncbi:SCO family protein [Acidihalobacter prosperus]|uniref:Thioredoxin domain-containing protein n=1 Tax=Acidihalobacter prosperus TaxID=160660 RepID=A0A1A6C421_9GAMM|nr:SCO family protein [Acidihalobacter prosperus]OBS09290.1 hypothetical protein Thpro_021618 [Acidihalobacter prosperus]
MSLFSSVLRDDSDRQAFWYSAAIGAFVGLLIGAAMTSLWSIVRAHEDGRLSADTRKPPAPAIALHRGPLAPFVTGFVDQNGKPVTTHDLLGKVRIVTFLSPLGDRYSPLVVSNLMNLYQELKDDGMLGKQVTFVSYNVDPAHTGPAQMADFFKQIAGIDPRTADWHFLTAQPATVRKLVTEGYGVHYRQIGDAAYAKLSAKQREDGEYLYAKAVNPLSAQYRPDYHVIGHDELVVVGPRDHIWARIPDASTVSNGELMRFIASLLKLPGMPGADHVPPAGGL